MKEFCVVVFLGVFPIDMIIVKAPDKQSVERQFDSILAEYKGDKNVTCKIVENTKVKNDENS